MPGGIAGPWPSGAGAVYRVPKGTRRSAPVGSGTASVGSRTSPVSPEQRLWTPEQRLWTPEQRLWALELCLSRTLNNSLSLWVAVVVGGHGLGSLVSDR